MPGDLEDFADVLGDIVNYIQNERVRAYNQGVDAERSRCAKLAASFIADNGRKGSLQSQLAADIRDGN